MPAGHTGTWPRYFPKQRNRTIACFDGRTITDEDGVFYPVRSWGELVKIAIDGHYDVYVSDLLSPDAFPFLLEAIADPHASVNASETGGVRGIRVRYGNDTRSISLARNWGSDIGGGFTHLLRGLFNYVGIGAYTTPGALGEALWAGLRNERMTVPNYFAANDLRRYAFGGRADNYAEGKHKAAAYEIDLRSAYVALCASVPTGTADHFIGESSHERYAAGTYYARCFVELPARRMAAYSPVPYRASTGRGEPSVIQYPNAGPFEFEAWLWREEVRRARRLGIGITIDEGWSWPWWDTDNAAWINRVTALRYDAPVDAFDDWIKRASVAAIGRHAIPPLSYQIIWDDDPRLTDDDVPLTANSPGVLPITGAWLHAELDPNPSPRLPHLWNYVTMRCRLETYDRMEAERKAGNRVLQVNFDSILLEQATTLPTGEAPGQWRQRKYTDVDIGPPRTVSYTNEQGVRIIKQPGVRRTDRDED